MRWGIIVVFILLAQMGFAKNYKTNTQTCYSYSRVPNLKTLKETCVGLVADKNSIPWKMPRKILFTDDNTALVTDMGGWGANNGKIWLLKFENFKLKSYQAIFTNTDRTHGIALGPDHLIYYGDAKAIYKFSLHDPAGSRTVVIKNLPDSYTSSKNKTTPSSHPLSEFIFLPNGDLIVNVGAPSNDCSEEYKESNACLQRDSQAELRRFFYNRTTTSHDPHYAVIARGLRNSMGLAFNEKTSEILQAENSADAPGTPDELNVVSLNEVFDFGWPFCFGFGQKYQGYNKFNSFCQRQAKTPLLLFPPHSAPLSLLYYQGEMFKEYSDYLMTSWHGHRPTGSRIALYKTDRNLYPIADPNKDPMTHPLFLIDGWQKEPKGRPAGLHYDTRGAVFIVDDINAALLVLAKTQIENAVDSDNSNTNTITANNLDQHLSKAQIQSWDDVYTTVVKKYNCAKCHSDIVKPLSKETLVSMLNNSWIEVSKPLDEQLIWIKMTGASGARIMPPSPSPNILSEQHLNNGAYQNLKTWLLNL